MAELIEHIDTDVDLVAQAIHGVLCGPGRCPSADDLDRAARAVLVALAGDSGAEVQLRAALAMWTQRMEHAKRDGPVHDWTQGAVDALRDLAARLGIDLTDVPPSR